MHWRRSAPSSPSSRTRPSGSSRRYCVPARVPLRILAVRERTVPLGAPMRNAAIGFAGMTASALAIVAEHQGRRVAGFAFDSIGRYAKGALLAERFMPRLLAAPPASLLDDSGLISPE